MATQRLTGKVVLAAAAWVMLVAPAKAASNAVNEGAAQGFQFPWEWSFFVQLTAAIGFLGLLLSVSKSPLHVIKLRDRYRALSRCYRLHRACGAGRRQAIATIIASSEPPFGLFTLSNPRLIAGTRRRIEHGIFRPRPEFSWPLPEDHPDYGVEVDEDPETNREELAKRHKWRMQAWQDSVAKVDERGAKHAIKILHPGRITKQQEEIQTYFGAVADIIGGASGNRFITPIEVRSGFIAPLHLLSGLLVHFSEKWPPIIDAFNWDGRHVNGIDFGDRSMDIRQIQLFIYNCWLLWGPSIPICKSTCGMWDAEFITMQYGFGDENNSIDIVGLADRPGIDGTALTQRVQALVDKEKARIDLANEAAKEQGDTPRSLSAMAIPARITGHLRSSESLKTREGGKELTRLPRAARNSYKGKQDDRPLLYVDAIELTERETETEELTEIFKVGPSEHDSGEPARYYSAYLWVAFVMLVEAPESRPEKPVWRPVHRDEGDKQSMDYVEALADGSKRPWFDLIPFFEHGNIADSETCQFLKRQLARKIVGAFLEVVEKIDVDAPKHRFAYACAIDDPGCTPDHFLMPDLQGGETLKAIIARMLDAGEEKDRKAAVTEAAEARARGEKTGKVEEIETRLSPYAAVKKIIDFDAYGRSYHPLAACTFPTHVDHHYESMTEMEERLRAWRATNQPDNQDYFDDDPYWEAYRPRGKKIRAGKRGRSRESLEPAAPQ
ncbi:hypothetical protein FHS91_001209 [Sphingobium xanthum]|uniref:hypothetical protein n=1 Tax=Sphingobium xanthum TaxID=1387165 RepID=UPI001C8C7B1E|nr:hypothetical protein [Sphingobium xanthum]